jgi:putative transcriptional regulator
MSEYFESLQRSLNEALEYAQGKIELKSRYVAATPPKQYTADEIRRIRDNLKMSQGFFADVIGVSKKTVESWEYGRGKPSGAAARMISIVEVDPEALRRYEIAQW